MARRRENMLEAFKASRDQALEERRQALAPPAESVAQRLQRSLQKTLPKGADRRGETAPKLRVKDHRKAQSGGVETPESKAEEAQTAAAPGTGDGFIGVDAPDQQADSRGDFAHADADGADPEQVSSGTESGTQTDREPTGLQTQDPDGSKMGQENQALAQELTLAPDSAARAKRQPADRLATRGRTNEVLPEPLPGHLPGVGNGFLVSPKFLIAYSFTLAALSFFLGWQFGSSGSASDQGGETVQATGVPQVLPDPLALPGQEPTPAPEPAGAEQTQADLAFQNPANHWTLVVDQFTNNRPGRERAVHHYHYLRDQGFPVIQPRVRGPVVFLLVGAAPGQDELDDLLGQVRVLAYPGSQDRTFSSVYPERISDFF